MPVYEYTAIDAQGRTRKGIASADSLQSARSQVRARGLFPRELRETTAEAGQAAERGGRRSISLNMRLGRRVSARDRAAATRQIATLLSAGFPLETSLSMMLPQMNDGPLKRVLSQVRERVKEGRSFAAALEEHPRVFGETFASMVRAGESSGTLDMVMERLADFSEQQIRLSRKIQSTVAYPLLMLVVGVGVAIFLVTYVVPRVTSIFVDLEQALPLPTIVLIWLSGFVQQWWFVFPVIVVGAWLWLRWYAARPKGRLTLDRLKLGLPLIGPVNRQIALARFSRTLGTLLQQGVEILSALKIVRSIVGNEVVRGAVDDVSREASHGGGIGQALAGSGVFDPTAVQMIAAGEQSGNLAQMLVKVAEMAENETENRLATLTSMLEPVLILGLGAGVGFVVLAVLLPIFEMSGLVR